MGNESYDDNFSYKQKLPNLNLWNGENTTTKDISGNDPEMIYYLNINGTDVYSTYIKPNLG